MTHPHTTGTTQQLDVHQVVTELTRPHRHSERYERHDGTTRYADLHTTKVPALLDQLAASSPASTERYNSTAYSSRPVANLEALDTLARIDIEAARWIRDLGEDDFGDTKTCIIKLASLILSAHENTRREIEADLRRWRTQARIASGWDIPAWKPRNTCPNCAGHGTLRVHRNDLSAMCTDCRATWDETTIGLLAEHIRTENDDLEQPDDTHDHDQADPIGA